MKNNLNFKEYIFKIELLRETEQGKLKGGICTMDSSTMYEGRSCNTSQCNNSNNMCTTKLT